MIDRALSVGVGVPKYFSSCKVQGLVFRPKQVHGSRGTLNDLDLQVYTRVSKQVVPSKVLFRVRDFFQD